MSERRYAIFHGITSAVAAILSFKLNHDIFWMAIHFLFGYIYLVYAVLMRPHEVKMIIDSLVAAYS